MGIPWTQISFTLLAALSAGTMGLTAGSALLGGGGRLQVPGAAISVVALVLGALVSVAHLGHPELLVAVFANLGSPLPQGVLALAASLAVSLAYLFKARREPGAGRVLRILALACSVVAMLILSRFYYLPDRPVWTAVVYFATCLVLAGLLGCITTFLLCLLAREGFLLKVFGWSGVVLLVATLPLLSASAKAMRVSSFGTANPNAQEASSPKKDPHLDEGGSGGNGYGETPSWLEQK